MVTTVADRRGHSGPLHPPSTDADWPSAWQLSESDYRDAERRWRRFQNEQIRAEDLPSIIEAENRHRCLLAARLSVEDLAADEQTAVVGGIAFSAAKLLELGKLAGLHARAARLPDYGLVRPKGDLGPRFDSARYVDLVDLAQTLTGVAATPSGNGRYRMPCCFHEGDRDPSLVFFGLGRGFHCFGCGATGSAIDFVSLHLKVDVVSALFLIEELCDTYPEAWGGEVRSS